MKLGDLITEQFRLKESQKMGLKKMRILTLRDLLMHLPARYISAENVVTGKVISQETKKSWKSKMAMATMTLEDVTGRKIKAVWFRQAYMAKQVPEGTLVQLSGPMREYKGTLTLSNPQMNVVDEKEVTGPLFRNETLDVPTTTSGVKNPEMSAGNGSKSDVLLPVYPESRGINSLWFVHAVQKILKAGLANEIEDPIPADILRRYNLPSLSSALLFIHSPKKESDALAARKRFSFQEIFLIQLARQQARLAYKHSGSFVIKNDTKLLKQFTDSLPFTLTQAQDSTIKTILDDLSRPEPMMRLLEGDVGSGKTAVAAAVAHMVISQRLQVAYMAPTEILAKQHFESFIELFKDSGLQIALVTGSECRKFPSKITNYVNGKPELSAHVSRTQVSKWLADGSVSITIGTHALIQESLKWKNLALVIVDEQHRFGTRQRAELAKKSGKHGSLPHLLSMTATPIPRTLALTIYGDLDLSLLDQTPPGRKPIITEVLSMNDRPKVYEKMREQLKLGRQAYVICPRIDLPDPTKPARTYRDTFGTGGEMAMETKDVMSETERLGNDVFAEYMVGAIHGKMSADEKDTIMREFAAGEIHILVATSVVEVGVNVPNATIILIEGAERFGLSQLHQLRGRVLRSSHQAYCYLATTKEQKTVSERLKAITKAKNGFELAEQDLKLRGPGSLVGIKQSGISDVGMEALQNLKMVEAARQEARALLESDPTLARHHQLASRIAESTHHFE